MASTRHLGSVTTTKAVSDGQYVPLTDQYGNLMKIAAEDLVSNTNSFYNDAFYIDINSASSKGSTRVDVGGNLNMRAMWENAKKPILMDKDGNY